MATLTADKARSFTPGGEGAYNTLTVAASQKLYQGEAVSPDAGGDIQTLNAGDSFEGFVDGQVDNTTGGDGDKSVLLLQKGILHNTPVTGVTGVGDVGSTVYMSDGGTFTLTEGSNSDIGKVIRYLSGTSVDIEFCAGSRRSL